MADLIYSAIASLDGYVADAPPAMRDFAEIWRAADKIVYSTTLDSTSTARTRIERSFDPDSVRSIKTDAERDLGIGGANLAWQAIRAGLVDELQLFLVPIVVGGGTRAFRTTSACRSS